MMANATFHRRRAASSEAWLDHQAIPKYALRRFRGWMVDRVCFAGIGAASDDDGALYVVDAAAHHNGPNHHQSDSLRRWLVLWHVYRDAYLFRQHHHFRQRHSERRRLYFRHLFRQSDVLGKSDLLRHAELHQCHHHERAVGGHASLLFGPE